MHFNQCSRIAQDVVLIAAGWTLVVATWGIASHGTVALNHVNSVTEGTARPQMTHATPSARGNLPVCAPSEHPAAGGSAAGDSAAIGERLAITNQEQLMKAIKDGFSEFPQYEIHPTAFDEFVTDVDIEGVRSRSVIGFRPGTLNDGVSVNFINCRGLRLAGVAVKGNVTFSPGDQPNVGFGDRYGVVNFVDCEDIELVDPVIQNTRRYEFRFGRDLQEGTEDDIDETLQSQSSCALNIVRSNHITIRNAHIKSYGKSTILVHGGSKQIEFLGNRTNISGAYFEFNIAASDVVVKDATITSNLLVRGPKSRLIHIHDLGYTNSRGREVRNVGDSHPPINVTASYGESNGGPVARDSNVIFSRVMFDLRNGRSIVTGNADAQVKKDGGFYVSNIELSNCILRFRGPPQFGHYGFVGYSPRWFGINLVRKGGKIMVGNVAMPIVLDGKDPNRLLDFVTTVNTGNYDANTGLGKFVFYQKPVSMIPDTQPPRFQVGDLPKNRVIRSDGLSAYDVMPN